MIEPFGLVQFLTPSSMLFDSMRPLLPPERSTLSCDRAYSFQSVSLRPPRVPHVSFPPSTCLIYPMRFRVVIGLRLVKQSYPRMRPYMRFLYVRPEVCPRVSIFPESSFLQIPPHGGHPCFRLCPSHYRADSGLSPVRDVRRRAHHHEKSSRVPSRELHSR